ncbi:MAG: hypothetical protein LBS05_11485 [Tannerellaceae bacterium]|jgi:chromosome segregation ATPase|nr:hypothetical protein [Tannerellaceae bacterium]
MDTNELLIAISGLEKNLKDIDSAREQVNKTIEAYKGVHGQVESYTKSLEKVSQNIFSMIDAVKSNRQILGSELDKELKGKFKEMEGKLSDMKAIAQSSSEKFATQCELATSEIQNTLNKTSESFNSTTTDIQANSKVLANNILTNFRNNIDAETEKLDNCIQQLNNALSNFTKLHLEIEQKIAEYYNPVKRQLKAIENQNKFLSQAVNKNRKLEFILIGLVAFIIVLNVCVLILK